MVLTWCSTHAATIPSKEFDATASGGPRDTMLTRRLVRVSAANGLLVVYTKQANDVASDDSPFMSAFLKNVGKSV
jgi:hypothetical protein